MIVRMVSGEPTDGGRMERATRLAKLALGRYGLCDARLRLLSHGFKEVFLVAPRSQGRFVLKTYGMTPEVGEEVRRDPRYRTGPGLRSPETIEAQLHWLSALGRETDLAVPEPVPLPDGSLVRQISFPDLPPLRSLLRRMSARHRELYPSNHPPRHFALLRWVPGEHKGDPTADDLSRVGRLAAGLHDHAEGYRPPDASAFPRWDWSWPFGASAPLWEEGRAFYSTGEMAVFEEASRRVRENLEGLGYGSGVFGLIHRDLTLTNLLFGGPGAAPRRAAGVTDFDQAGLGHYLFDLVVVLRTPRARWRRAGYSPELSDEWVQEALLAGYESTRGFPPVHGGLFGTLDVMQRIAAVNRTLELRASPAAARGPAGRSSCASPWSG